jgi:hypothetical protein
LSVVVVMWNFWVVMWIKDSLVARHHTGKEQLIPQCVLDQWVCTLLCHFCLLKWNCYVLLRIVASWDLLSSLQPELQVDLWMYNEHDMWTHLVSWFDPVLHRWCEVIDWVILCSQYHVWAWHLWHTNEKDPCHYSVQRLDVSP